MIPGPGCSGSRMIAAPTLCSVMNWAASRSVRRGVSVRTSSVIAWRTIIVREDTSLELRESAVDDDALPGDVAGLVGQQEDRRVRYLPGRPLAAERDRRARPAGTPARRQAPERRVHEARREHVGAHAAARALHR